MKIIITGATGSLGAYLTRYFCSLGHTIIACGRDIHPPENLLRYAEYFNADIARPFQFPEADACIHAAALSDDKATFTQLFQPNVTGTKHTSKAAGACNTFIQISSSAVYLPDPHPLTEDMAGKQNNKLLSPYGKSKLLAEEVLIETTTHPSCYILRPRALYGAGDRVILPRILKLVKKNEFKRPGKMGISVSLTHYENMAHAINLCLQSGKRGIHVYNVSDDKVYVFAEVIRKIIKELYQESIKEKEISIRFLKFLAVLKIGGITPLLVRSFTRDMVLDITRIKKELNYSTAINLDSKLSELGSWVRTIGGTEAIKSGNREYAWK